MLRPDAIIGLLHHYGYAFLFVIAFIEGPIVTVLAAFLAAQRYFNIYVVYGVVVVADLAGDLLYYAVGRFGRMSAFEKLANYIGFSPERFHKLETYFVEHGAKAMFYAKYTQTGFVALPAAGAAGMPIGPFLFYNAIATLPKSLALTVLGYFFGYAYSRIDSYFERASLILVFAGIFAGGYFVMRHFRHSEA
jgi:membrane protein DedA with SNARE-associated domain